MNHLQAVKFYSLTPDGNIDWVTTGDKFEQHLVGLTKSFTDHVLADMEKLRKEQELFDKALLDTFNGYSEPLIRIPIVSLTWSIFKYIYHTNDDALVGAEQRITAMIHKSNLVKPCPKYSDCVILRDNSQV